MAPKRKQGSDQVAAANGYESDASVKSYHSRSSNGSGNSRQSQSPERAASPAGSTSAKSTISFRQRRRAAAVAAGSANNPAAGLGRPLQKGPKVCAISISLKRKHDSEGDDPVVGTKRRRVWGDYTKDGRPRCGACRQCKSVHVKLFPELSQKALCEKLEDPNDTSVKVKFENGCEVWAEKEKKKLEVAGPSAVAADLPTDSPEELARKLHAREEEEAAAYQKQVATVEEQQETASRRTLRADRSKRRGQFVMRSVWNTENPGFTPGPEDIEFKKSRKSPGAMIEYVKCYRDKDEERLDFSEEEAEEIRNDKVLDDGSCVLDSEQARA